jgi:hypothetical protein
MPAACHVCSVPDCVAAYIRPLAGWSASFCTGNREIAETLALTEGTVKNYISAILAKTGLHDRTRAALYAVRHNLTDRDSSE